VAPIGDHHPRPYPTLSGSPHRAFHQPVRIDNPWIWTGRARHPGWTSPTSRSTTIAPLPSERSRPHSATPSCRGSKHARSHRCTRCSRSSDGSRRCSPRWFLRAARAISLLAVLLWRCSHEQCRGARMGAGARDLHARPTHPVVRDVWSDGYSRDVRADDRKRRELTRVVDQCLVHERSVRAVRPTDEATRIRQRGGRAPSRDGFVVPRDGRLTERGQCPTGECRATFDASSPREGDVRYCNRAGTDGRSFHAMGRKALASRLRSHGTRPRVAASRSTRRGRSPESTRTAWRSRRR
jgi:hypothetical protein